MKQVVATFDRLVGLLLFGELRVKSAPLGIVLAGLIASLVAPSIAFAQSPNPQASKKPPIVINPPPTAQDWADLAKLPDWTGVWNPKITDQDAQAKTNPPPWNE